MTEEEKYSSKELDEWFKDCPVPVIGGVLDDPYSLRQLSYSHWLYEEGTLAVVPVEIFEKLLEKT